MSDVMMSNATKIYDILISTLLQRDNETIRQSLVVIFACPPVFQAETRIEVQGPCVSPFESRSQVRAA
jgi:tRNA U34 5-carboxymethylaminomethyl modifying GTPase MnmE/TrmE